MAKIKPFICSILVLLICFCNVITAYALPINESYLSPTKWQSLSNSKQVVINGNALGNSANGRFKYYIDTKNNIVYTFCEVVESSLDINNDNVYINLEFINENDTYILSIGKDGLNEETVGMKSFFDVKQSFETNVESLGTYMTAVKINNGELLNTMNVDLFVNGHCYKILRDIVVDATIEEITTTEKPTTTKVSTTKQSAKATTKKPTTTKKAKTTKSKKGTTKFVNNNSNYANYSQKFSVSENNEVTTTSIQVPVTQVQQKNSDNTIGIIITTVCAVLGVVFIIKGLITKKD